MGSCWVAKQGKKGTITVSHRDDAWYLTKPHVKSEVKCVVRGIDELPPTDVCCELEGTVSKYMRSTNGGPDFLFFEVGDKTAKTPTRVQNSDPPQHSKSRDTNSQAKYPRRRITELSGSGDYVTVEAVIDSIKSVNKDDSKMPDIIGKLRDEKTGRTRTFVVANSVRHPYLKIGTRLRLTGVKDHHYAKYDQTQVYITNQTEFEKLGVKQSEKSKKPKKSKQSAGSKNRRLKGIAKSKIGNQVFTETDSGDKSSIEKAKRKARKQGRDPAIDPRLKK